MKKQIIAGSISAILAAMPIVGTFATTGAGDYDHDATVGNVGQTIYSVDITWGDMSFDWRYDSSTNSFKFEQSSATDAAIKVVTSVTNGKAKCTASFTSTDSYDWVKGIFWDDVKGTAFSENNGIFSLTPEMGSINTDDPDNIVRTDKYLSRLVLESVDEPGTVTADDKIGTITVTVAPDTDAE